MPQLATILDTLAAPIAVRRLTVADVVRTSATTLAYPEEQRDWGNVVWDEDKHPRGPNGKFIGGDEMTLEREIVHARGALQEFQYGLWKVAKKDLPAAKAAYTWTDRTGTVHRGVDAVQQHIREMERQADVAMQTLTPEHIRELQALYAHFAEMRYDVVYDTNDYDRIQHEREVIQSVFKRYNRVQAARVKSGAITKAPPRASLAEKTLATAAKKVSPAVRAALEQDRAATIARTADAKEEIEKKRRAAAAARIEEEKKLAAARIKRDQKELENLVATFGSTVKRYYEAALAGKWVEVRIAGSEDGTHDFVHLVPDGAGRYTATIHDLRDLGVTKTPVRGAERTYTPLDVARQAKLWRGVNVHATLEDAKAYVAGQAALARKRASEGKPGAAFIAAIKAVRDGTLTMWKGQSIGSEGKTYQRAVAAFAAQHGMTVADYLAAVDTHLQALVNRCATCIRVPYSLTDELFKDGEFKTQFETATSKGANSPAMRRRFEQEFFGIPEYTGNEDRPRYGFLAEDPVHETQSRQYGSVIYRIKANRDQHVTITFGDSLGIDFSPNQAPASLHSVTSLAWSFGSGTYTRQDPLELKRIDDYEQYVEAQYHGKLTMQDIAEVIFTSEEPTKAQRATLDKLGIPWQYHDPRPGGISYTAKSLTAAAKREATLAKKATLDADLTAAREAVKAAKAAKKSATPTVDALLKSGTRPRTPAAAKTPTVDAILKAETTAKSRAPRTPKAPPLVGGTS